MNRFPEEDLEEKSESPDPSTPMFPELVQSYRERVDVASRVVAYAVSMTQMSASAHSLPTEVGYELGMLVAEHLLEAIIPTSSGD